MAKSKIEHFPRHDRDRDKIRDIAEASSSPKWLHRISFEQGLEPLLVFDIGNRVVVDANQRAEELTGYAREELLDLRLEDLHPRSSREKTIGYFQKILDHGSYDYDDLVRRADGDPAWFWNETIRFMDIRFDRPYDRSTTLS